MKTSFILFFSALLIRIGFVFFQGSNLEQKLIEDEMMYWIHSLHFFNTGELQKDIVTERMSGIFIYYKILLWITSKNLQFLLLFQTVIDSFSCLMLYKISCLIVPRQKFFVYGFAVFSPLMIILSAQVLSETIFLFLFTFFLYFTLKVIIEKKNLFFYIMIAGLFLGLATSIRSITFPLIFLSLIPLTFILIKIKIIKLKLFVSLSIFLISALSPISFRLINNIKEHNTYSLNSQAGMHLAYWVVPSILAGSEKINRAEAIKIIDKESNKYTFSDDPYKNSKILRSIGFKVLSEVELSKVLYFWAKGMFINISAPSVLLDKKLRSLPHPSYYEISDPVKWFYAIASKEEYRSYLILIMCISITSIFSIFSFIIGPIFLYKQNKYVFYLCLLYILYFLIIAGPVISPKYIFPILPCVFLYQAIALAKTRDALYYYYLKFKK